jgi:hypothetical protein
MTPISNHIAPAQHNLLYHIKHAPVLVRKSMSIQINYNTIDMCNNQNAEKTPAELEETVEYEMDSEDERFVHTINDANNKLKAASNRKIPPLLTDDGFEKMIDVLEKEAFRKIHKVRTFYSSNFFFDF